MFRGYSTLPHLTSPYKGEEKERLPKRSWSAPDSLTISLNIRDNLTPWPRRFNPQITNCPEKSGTKFSK